MYYLFCGHIRSEIKARLELCIFPREPLPFLSSTFLALILIQTDQHSYEVCFWSWTTMWSSKYRHSSVSFSTPHTSCVCVCVISWFSGFADEVETTSLWHTLRFVEEEERYYRTLNRVAQIPQRYRCRWGNVHGTWKTHLLLVLGNPENKTSGSFCPELLITSI